MPTSQPLASTVPPDMLVVWTIAAVRPVEPAGTQLAASALEAPTRIAEAPTPTPTPQNVTPDSTALRIRRPASPPVRSPFRTLRSPSSLFFAASAGEAIPRRAGEARPPQRF